LAEADLEAVFKPFHRADKSRSRDTGGVGLGLAVVRAVATAHGGAVRLENRSEGGLRATVVLPAG
jgi:signal transduction histidine kinase